MKEYLPIGSVVTLKNGTKKVMICEGYNEKRSRAGSMITVPVCIRKG